MLDLLSGDARAEVTRRIQELVAAGDLQSATRAVHDFIEQSRDDNLIQAARGAATADLDWALVCAEAIEADVQLKGKAETGCRFVEVDLGNQSHRRLDVIRHYHAVDGAQPTRKGRPAGGIGGYHAVLHEAPLRVSGLQPLAELQLSPYPRYPAPREEQDAHQRRTMLAGHLLVLRYFDAVQRHARTDGLPFPTALHVGVESITGEDAISQIGPSLDMDLACSVRPAGSGSRGATCGTAPHARREMEGRFRERAADPEIPFRGARVRAELLAP